MADKIDISAVAWVVDQASGPIRAIETAIGRAATSAKTASASFATLGKAGAFGGLATNLRGVGSSVMRLGGQIKSVLGPALGIAGIAGIGGAVAAMRSYITTADQTYNASRRLGVSGEDLQKWRYAAEQSGVSAETFDSGLGQLQRRLANLARGGKDTEKLIPLLQKFGISLDQIKAGDLAAILPRISEGFKQNVNPLTRTAMATALFGKSGAGLINVLALGREELAAYGEEAVRLGIITQQQLDQANKADAAWKQMERAFAGVRNTLAAELVPALTTAIRAITEWIVANREWLRTKFTEAITRLGEIIRSIDWTKVVAGIEKFGRGIVWLVGLIGGWENAFIALMVLMNANFISSVLGLVVAVGKLAISFVTALPAIWAFSAALLANPITWIVGLIALLAAGAYLLWRNWDKVGPFFTDLWAGVKAAFWGALAWLGEFLGNFAAGNLTAAWGMLRGAFEGIWNGVKAAFWTARDWLGEFLAAYVPQPIQDAWAGLVTGFSTLWGGVRSTFWRALDWCSEFADLFAAGDLVGAWGMLQPQFARIWSGTKTVFWGALDWLGEFAALFEPPAEVKAAWAWLPGWFSGVRGNVEAAWAGLDDWLSGIWGGAETVIAGALDGLRTALVRFVPQPLQDAWAGFGAWWSSLWGESEATTETGLAGLRGVIAGFVPQPLQDAWDGLSERFSGIWGDAGAAAATGITTLGTLIAGFVPQPIKDAWETLSGFFDRMWSRITGLFEQAWATIKPIIGAIIAAVAPLTGIVSTVTGAIGAVAGAAGRIVRGVIGGGAGDGETAAEQPAMAPGGRRSLFGAAGDGEPAAARPNLLQQATAAATPAMQGEIEQRLKVDLSPGLRATLESERTRGPVRSDVEIGRSMEPAWGAA